MPCKIEYLTFSLLLALSACSGGGDSLLPGILDADSNVDSQEALILNEENYTELSSLASELVNSQIFYAQEIGKLLSLVDTSSSQLLTPQCTTSGSLDTDVIDNDQNQRLSAGDQVSFQFRSCTDDSGRQLDGRVSLSLSMVDDLEPGSIHTRFNAELNDFLSNQRIDDNSTVTINRNGRLTADILYSPERVSISVINPESGVIHDVTANEERQTLTNSGSVTSDIASRSSVRLQLRAAQREYDYSNYTYSLSFDAVIQQSNWANPLELETTNPFSGVINSFPIEGGVQLSAGQNSRLRINPEAPGSTLTVPQLDTGDGIFNQVSRTPWGLLANLNLWTDPRIKNEVRIRTYIPDDRDMEFLYQSSVEEGKNVLLNQRFLLQFSDVIDTEAIEQSSLSVYFQSLSTTLAPSVNGVAEISGAQLVAYPEQPLMPGENYRLYINSVYNSQGDSDDYFLEFTTFNNLRALATSESEIYSIGDQIPLLGSSSRIENHPFARALWRQISGPAALIQAPNELDTSVIIPSFSTNAESLYFELEVENSLGETSIAQTQVIAVSDPTNVLFFDVDSHLGGSSSSTLKATLTADNSSYIDVYYGSESLDIEFSSAGVNSPRVSLGLFSGMPNTPIAPGEYLDTQRYPDFGEPRLQFSSSSSSCTLRGGFNVHELAVDSNNQVLRAAIDFVGLCSDYTLPNKGSIRINSTRRIEFPALP